MLRHNAIVLAIAQSYWDAFGIGKETKTTHPADGSPTTKNPALLDAKAGLPAQFDGLSVPQFIAEANAAVIKLIPGSRPLPFGHAGDGNIHYNVTQPEGSDKEAFLKRWDEVNAVVFEVVQKLGGSISAEHGVGIVKRDYLPKIKDPVAYDLMKTLKRTLDPKGILNPGKVLP